MEGGCLTCLPAVYIVLEGWQGETELPFLTHCLSLEGLEMSPSRRGPGGGRFKRGGSVPWLGRRAEHVPNALGSRLEMEKSPFCVPPPSPP